MLDWWAAQEAIETIRHKWIFLVLAQLTDGSKGYNELARRTGLDNKTLTRALRYLEANGLLAKQAVGDGPHTNYSLTPQAHCLIVLLEELANWWRRR